MLSCENQEQTSRSVHVWSTEHWPSGCELPAHFCSRSTGAAWRVCRRLPRTAVARVGCSNSVLYATTGASIKIISIGYPDTRLGTGQAMRVSGLGRLSLTVCAERD